MLDEVRLIAEMDEKTWVNLQKDLLGISDVELGWRPHPAANSVRWIVGHLAWFEEWVHDALLGAGRYLTDEGPQSYDGDPFPVVRARFESAHAGYRDRMVGLAERDLTRTLNYLRRYEVTVLDRLETHALHLAGHRYQIRYIRGAYSRAHGTRKADFDPW